MGTIGALLPDLKALGFEINSFGKTSFVINGAPPDMQDLNAKEIIEDLISQFYSDHAPLKMSQQEKIAIRMAKKMAIKYGQSMVFEEIKTLCEQLFLCEHPLTSPTGKPTLISCHTSLIDKQLS